MHQLFLLKSLVSLPDCYLLSSSRIVEYEELITLTASIVTHTIDNRRHFYFVTNLPIKPRIKLVSRAILVDQIIAGLGFIARS